MKRPFVSVIMTVYNGEQFIEEALDALWAQTFSNFEVVVVNNGCTDGTQAILDSIKDDRLRVITAQEHGTFGDGIRLAYQNVRGEYIAVQDADDISLPERLALQVSALEDDLSLGAVFGGYYEIDINGVVGDTRHPPANVQDLKDTMQTANPLAHSTYMYRRVASEQVQGYPKEYAYGPDFGLVIRIMKKGWNVKVLSDIVLKLRVHPGQASIIPQLSAVRAHDALYLYKEAVKIKGISPNARAAGSRNIAKCRIRYGLASIGEFKALKGLQQIAAGLLAHPIFSLAYLGYLFGAKVGIFHPR